MWDPISVLACMWIMNAGLPEARLSVNDIILFKENNVIKENIKNSITIREGVNE